MRIINEMQSTQDAIHRSLSIELLSMHPFAPFGQIELAAGREGEDEAKAAYQSAKTGPGATKPDRRFQMLARQSATYVKFPHRSSQISMLSSRTRSAYACGFMEHSPPIMLHLQLVASRQLCHSSLLWTQTRKPKYNNG